MTLRRLLLLAAAAVPSAAGIASAQVPGYPTGNVPQPPINLDPGATGTQAPPPPPQPVQQPAAPNVVVVRPDGSVTTAAGQPPENAAPTGYFIDSGSSDLFDPRLRNVGDRDTNLGTVPELHVVRAGDTLWDICWYYFNDPWQWPKIWSYNPQITNPHWIYPGDLVRLLPRGQFAQTSTGPAAAAQPAATDKALPPVRDNLPAPAKKLGVALHQVAFVEQSDLDKSIVIDGSVDEKMLLGKGDVVYLRYKDDNPPEIGKPYSIYVVREAVPQLHGRGKDYGSYVQLLGTLQVTSVQQDKRARATITESNMEIQRGAHVGPLLKEFSTVPPVAPKTDVQGNIVAMLARDQLIGQGELVFIDQGDGSGLEVGNRLFVVRRGDAYPGHASTNIGQDDRRFPARALGEVVIVEVGTKISVGLVTLSVQEMGVGDVVMMQAAAK